MARPSVDLDWAENDVVDPTSGENNKVEPPTAWKNNGWSYQEKPPRNYDNYHKWNTGQWIKYLDQIGARPATQFLAASDAAAETKLHADIVCDGTDDHTDINTAITAAAATGGKVLLSEGTFVIAGEISLSSNIHLQGMGIGATTIQVEDSDSGTYTILDIDTLGAVTVSDLSIDGNSLSASSNNTGIAVASSMDVTLRNLIVKNISRSASAGNGIHISGSSRVKVLGCAIRDCQYFGIWVESNAADIVDCTVSGSVDTNVCLDSSSTGCSVINTSILSGDNVGLLIDGSLHQVIGCDIVSSDGYNVSMGGDNSLVLGCVIKDGDNHGVYIAGDADGCTVADCLISTNGQGTHDTYSGIHFVASASNNTVTDCKILKGASSPQQKYGIDVSNVSTSDRNYVYNNDCYFGGATSPIFVSTGGAKTIPAYVGSSTSANVLDDVTKANITA